MSEESNRAVSPLRQRMIEDMCMRKMQDRTQEAYIRGVRRLARFLGRSPDTATSEDLRQFQLHLVRAGVSAITLNATLGVMVSVESYVRFSAARTASSGSTVAHWHKALAGHEQPHGPFAEGGRSMAFGERPSA